MGLFGSIKTNWWAARNQAPFEDAIRRGDQRAVDRLIEEGARQALQAALTKRDRAVVEMFIDDAGKARLAAAFQRGTQRDARHPNSLNNGLLELGEEAGRLAQELHTNVSRIGAPPGDIDPFWK